MSENLTCAQRVKQFLENISEDNERLNIFLEVFEDESLKRAEELDKKQENRGKLYGKVFALKSNIFMKDKICSCASDTLGKVEAIYNSDVVEYILSEDAIVIGMVNNDEFAQGSSGEHSFYGKTLNPKNENIIPGGTSSGSAAAVAANMCDIALGTDTGGSCRNPASHCGVFGFKPSYGRVSRYGVVDSSMSFDQVGILANTIDDLERTLEVIGRYSENDATTLQIDQFEKNDCEINKVGILKGVEELIIDKEIKEVYLQTIDSFKHQGIEVKEVELEHIELGVAAYYPIVYTEVFSGTRKFDSVKFGKKIDEVSGNELKLRMEGGRLITQSEFEGAYYKKALAVKEMMKENFSKLFEDVDCILIPTTPKLPHTFGTQLSPEDEYAYDVFTVLANLAGICSGVVPIENVSNESGIVPVGMQIMANSSKENIVFSAIRKLL